jgi:uncharacterized protein YdeI (YjbR/CyaY-like superfamily)
MARKRRKTEAAPLLLEVDGPEAWRAWLLANHDQVRAVWLVFWKKHTGKQRLSYEQAVEEALCVGWIDSTIRRLDEERYAQQFTPRTDSTKWSPSNRVRLRRLLAAGRMTPAGLARIDASMLAAVQDPAPVVRPRGPRPPAHLPPELEAVLRESPEAWAAFQRLAPSHRRNYVGWITAAKREETRRRRLAEAVDRLSRGEPLGMK